jgi:hypothetical protein
MGTDVGYESCGQSAFATGSGERGRRGAASSVVSLHCVCTAISYPIHTMAHPHSAPANRRPVSLAPAPAAWAAPSSADSAGAQLARIQLLDSKTNTRTATRKHHGKHTHDTSTRRDSYTCLGEFHPSQSPCPGCPVRHVVDVATSVITPQRPTLSLIEIASVHPAKLALAGVE